MSRLIQATAEVAFFNLNDQLADVIFTSPPYWPSPDYPVPAFAWRDGWFGRLGQEPEVGKYARHLKWLLLNGRRLLKEDGLLWLVLGRHRGDHGCIDVPAEGIVALTHDNRHAWHLVEHLVWMRETPQRTVFDSVLVLAKRPRAWTGGGRKFTDTEIVSGSWTSFTEEMVRYALLHGPDQGTLMDPFCGAGTALVAAKEAGWGFIGIDADPGGIQEAARRTKFPSDQIEVL